MMALMPDNVSFSSVTYRDEFEEQTREAPVSPSPPPISPPIPFPYTNNRRKTFEAKFEEDEECDAAYNIAKTSNVDNAITKGQTSYKAEARKSVTFAPEASVFLIIHVDEIPEEVVAACWYNDCEYARIKREYRRIIRLMESGYIVEDENQTERGLEFHTRHGALTRRSNRYYISSAVRAEQERQWDIQDESGADEIAKMSAMHSAKSRSAAFLAGMRDQAISEALMKAVKV